MPNRQEKPFSYVRRTFPNSNSKDYGPAAMNMQGEASLEEKAKLLWIFDSMQEMMGSAGPGPRTFRTYDEAQAALDSLYSAPVSREKSLGEQMGNTPMVQDTLLPALEKVLGFRPGINSVNRMGASPGYTKDNRELIINRFPINLSALAGKIAHEDPAVTDRRVEEDINTWLRRSGGQAVRDEQGRGDILDMLLNYSAFSREPDVFAALMQAMSSMQNAEGGPTPEGVMQRGQSYYLDRRGRPETGQRELAFYDVLAEALVKNLFSRE